MRISKVARSRVGGALGSLGGALLGTFLFMGAARAQTYGAVEVGPAVEGTLLAVSLAPLVVNAVYVAKGTRPPLAWPILGFVLGALGGATGLAYALPNASSIDDSASLKIALGWALVAEGAVNIGMGIWALTLPATRSSANPPDRSARWALAPLVLHDPGGRPRLGASVSVVTF